MKKFIFVLVALCAMNCMQPASAYQGKVGRVVWNHGIDLTQASLLFCLANGISADKARLSGMLGNMMSNKTFRIVTMVNMGRALYYAAYA